MSAHCIIDWDWHKPLPEGIENEILKYTRMNLETGHTKCFAILSMADSMIWHLMQVTKSVELPRDAPDWRIRALKEIQDVTDALNGNKNSPQMVINYQIIATHVINGLASPPYEQKERDMKDETRP